MSAEIEDEGFIRLRRMQRRAMGCLLVAAVTFIVTIFLPPTFMVRLIKAGAEAAMVGGLADWFAVVALFRRPMGLPIPHTAIIPQSKDRIAESLSVFVREKFLNPLVLKELIQRSDPAMLLGSWLKEPANGRRLGRHAANSISAFLDVVDGKQVQAFILHASKTLVGRLDLSRALGSVLGLLTKDGRHQELLNSALGYLSAKLSDQTVRDNIARRIVDWLRTEHRYKQMLLPSEWLGEQAAVIASERLKVILDEVSTDANHELRRHFNAALKELVQKLNTSPAYREKGEEIKQWIQGNPQLGDYARELWATLRGWISDDLSTGSSQLQSRIERMVEWLGQRIGDDEELRTSINEHFDNLATNAAPQFAEFLTTHIKETIRKWDAKTMSEQIEVSIGPDLQFIRISGTAVGFVIGVVLFLLSLIPEAIR